MGTSESRLSKERYGVVVDWEHESYIIERVKNTCTKEFMCESPYERLCFYHDNTFNQRLYKFKLRQYIS